MEDYGERILSRDDETCRDCGTRSNLHVHHIKFRSQGGGDEDENLILICFKCHRNNAHGINALKYAVIYKRIAYERTFPERTHRDIYRDISSFD